MPVIDPNICKWLTFVGEGRSGHTIVSAIIGSHPNARIAEEQKYISKWYRNQWTKEQIINHLLQSGIGRARAELGFPEILTYQEPLKLIGDKCFGINTPILMYDGSIKMVQDVKVGDQLMGPDSKPRNVLSTNEGFGKLYKIIPTKGEAWICNENHILIVKKYKKKLEEVSVKKLFKLKTLKNCSSKYKQVYSSLINFPLRKIKIDPYFVGLWLGDGRKDLVNHGVEITNIDVEVISYLEEYTKKLNYKLVNSRCIRHFYLSPKSTPSHGSRKEKNFLLENLRNINLWDYVITDEKTRLEFLAGIIDSDGYYQNKSYFLIRQKDDFYSNLIVYAAKSLGFGVTIKKTPGKINNKLIGFYNRINIFGDIWRIPTKIKRKQAIKKQRKSDWLSTGFRIESLNPENYYGFNVDGDHQFLLGDFTIVHNCGWDAVDEYRKRGAPKSILNDFGNFIDLPIKTLVTLRHPLDNIGNYIVSPKYKRLYSDDNHRFQKMIKRYTRFYNAALEILENQDIYYLYNEELIVDPRTTITNLMNWLELPIYDEWLNMCCSKIFKKPNQRRDEVEWPKKYKRRILDYINTCPLLEYYR